MKNLLPSVCVLAALASCAKSNPQPAVKTVTNQALLVGTWNMTAETIATQAVGGGTTTTFVNPIAPGSRTVAYTADGKLTYSAVNTVPTTGTYAYTGNTLSLLVDGRPSVVTVTELTATKLVTVGTAEDTSTRYTTTDTFTR